MWSIVDAVCSFLFGYAAALSLAAGLPRRKQDRELEASREFRGRQHSSSGTRQPRGGGPAAGAAAALEPGHPPATEFGCAGTTLQAFSTPMHMCGVVQESVVLRVQVDEAPSDVAEVRGPRGLSTHLRSTQLAGG